MKVIYLNGIDNVDLSPSCVALGFFDGMHLGHQKLLDEVIKTAGEKGLKKGLLTFDVHPKSYLFNDSFKYLMSLDDKVKYLDNLAFDYLFVLHFNRDLAGMAPEQFVNDFIIKSQIKHVVCGFDFHFGYQGKGDGEYLKRMMANNYAVTIVDKLEHDHHKIASSYLRELLAKGNVELAKCLLGRPYQVTGEVIHGRKNGRKIGFPTVNIDARAYVLPKNGVYGAKVIIAGKVYLAMANLGYNPTFEALKQVSLEVNVFDFDQDVYGKEVTVLFLKHIRSEQKFASVDDLIKQLKSDKQLIIDELG